MKISPRFASHRHLLHVRLLPVALGFSACLAEDFPLIADSNRSPRKRNRSLDNLARKFRILKNHRAETRAGNLGLQREMPDIPRQRPDFWRPNSGNVGTSVRT